VPAVPELSRRLERVRWAPLAAAPAAYAALGWQRRWVSDDAFITLRCVTNLLTGHGPVFNPGERVEASTSTVWELVLAFVGVTRRALSLEWWAVLLGLACAVAGLALAQLGAVRLAGQGGRGQRPGPRPGHVALPLGALVVIALPPFWDFATSGLETGMVFAWLGLCFWGLVRAWERDEGDRFPRWLAVSIGLGPLVRPDIAVFAVGFAGLALALVVTRPWTWRTVAALAGWMGAVPAAYQLFRMAYYAALVPTPAIAKEAGATWWSQGLRYLGDLVGPYRLWAPLAVAGAVVVWMAWSCGRRREWVRLALVAVPVATGLLHGLFVVRVGGDFMHGRLLLPSVFGVLLPVMAVPVSRRTAGAVAAVAAVAAWAVVCGLAWRVPYQRIGPHGIADERGFYTSLAGRAHPVDIGDFRAVGHYQAAVAVRAVARRRERVLVVADDNGVPPFDIDLARSVRYGAVGRRFNTGIYGIAAGPGVYVEDELGLANPLGARIRLRQRIRPGHEKYLVPPWSVGRFADAAAPLPGHTLDPASVAAARRAIACPGPIRDLLDSLDKPLTLGRMVHNVLRSLRFTRMRFDPDPAHAAAEVCGPP
jgi:arabinofuranosyltransferase